MATLSEIKRRPIYDPWRLKEVRLFGSTDEFTSAAGLGPLLDLFYQSEWNKGFLKCMPARVGRASYDTAQFGLLLVAGFLYGHDCLDDLLEFQVEPLIQKKFGEIPGPKAFGDWLRDFEPEHISAFNELLCTQSFDIREKLAKNEPFILDIDSTSHVQRGKKIQGLAYNYKNEWCLDSLVAYDELGLCYGMDLRPGNTFSSQGSAQMIDRIFSHLTFKQKKFLRADSAFCEEETMKAALRHNAKFTLTAHDRIGWQAKALTIMNWMSWQWSDVEAKKALDAGIELPKIELGTYRYQPEWTDNLWFTVVVKRTWSFDKKLNEWRWFYYAVLTNWDTFYHKLQKIMEHHHGRGNSENFIREEKYGFDLKHFPCKKLTANHAYGLIALLTHNFLRAVALLDNPHKPHFSKKIRRKYVYIPGKIIRHAKQWMMKISEIFMKEVERLKHAWAVAFSPVLARAG